MNAVVTPLREAAREAAGRADDAAERGRWLGVLHGMPVSVKDVFATRGVPTTLGSAVYRDHVPGNDAEVVRRLRAAGAVLTAKDNLHELAAGSSSGSPLFGPCRNPWDLTRVPGGSSSGSAVAVAAGMTIGSVGTDAGGSVRGPAALNGLTGLRPTSGRISTWNDGLPEAPDFVVPGPMARRITDVARMLVALQGYDDRDVRSIRRPDEAVLGRLFDGVEGMRIGVARSAPFTDIDVDVDVAVRAAADTLAGLGAELVEIDLPGATDAGEKFDVIRRAQAAALFESQLDAAPERFGAEVRRRLAAGRKVTGTAYANAVACRQRWSRTTQRVFDRVDVVLTPSTPTVAPLAADEPGGPALAPVGVLLRPWSMADVPALSLPCGLSRDGLPVGVQLAGPPWAELRLLQAGAAFQEATDWHLRIPPHGGDPAPRNAGER